MLLEIISIDMEFFAYENVVWFKTDRDKYGNKVYKIVWKNKENIEMTDFLYCSEVADFNLSSE